MTDHDKMIEALAKVIGKSRDVWDSDNETAAAVLDLCGPERLVWVYDDGGIYANSYGGMYRIEYGDDGGMYLENSNQNYESNHNSEDEAKAAAQSHAYAAHWATTPLGKMVGV